MKTSHPFCPRLLLVGLALALIVGEQPACAQRIDEQQVKVAYVYNFAKFVDWPADAFATANDPIRLCVLDDQSFQLKLMMVVKDKHIAGRDVLSVLIHDVANARQCQILFINSTHNGVDGVLERLQGTSVLTIGETESFIDHGGIIGFLNQDGHVRFQVNHKAANQSGLRLRSQLLSVAKRVVE